MARKGSPGNGAFGSGFRVIPENPHMAKTASQYTHEGISHKRIRACKVCGKTFDSNFRYLTCYECVNKIRQRRDAQKGTKILVSSAILAVEKRKAEIKAAQRKKK